MKSKIYTAYDDGTRELSELYQIILDNFINGCPICDNILWVWLNDKISHKEKEKLSINFYNNKPKWYNSKFWWHKNYKGKVFWRDNTTEGNEQRKLFLQHLIKKYS